MTDFELETWIVESGADVIKKMTAIGKVSLTQKERLVYCIWTADYGMRNAGDLETAADLYADFQTEAASLAAQLNLPNTAGAFALPTAELQERYFGLLEPIVREVQSVR